MTALVGIARGNPAHDSGPDVAAQFHPFRWLGAPSPGALRLPEAKASASAMYGPRGVCLHDGGLLVCDSGNHRVLRWTALPSADHQPADIVIGQSSMNAEAPGLLHLPTGIAVHDGRLYVCDAWHHRVLVWNRVPSASATPPDAVIGQPDLDATLENRGGPPSRDSLYWPYGILIAKNRLFIADTGNRRVLVWDNVPSTHRPADHVIGQETYTNGEENRGEGVGPRSFRWPHAVAAIGPMLAVADAGNHRLLLWSSVADACSGRPADAVLGQPDFVTAREWPYGPQTGTSLRFPYHAVEHDGLLHIADTANNRVLLFDARSLATAAPKPLGVMGQLDLTQNGENRWAAVRHDTLCWPYGLSAADNVLAIADSGNNRVMLWRRDPSTPSREDS